MTIWIVIAVLAGHFLMDWYLQDRTTAISKSTNASAVIKHGASILMCTYILFWALGISFGPLAVILGFVYAFLHMAQDWLIYVGIPKPTNLEDYLNSAQIWNRIALDQFVHLTLLMVIVNVLL